MGLLLYEKADVAVEAKELGTSKKEADWTFRVTSAYMAWLGDILVLCAIPSMPDRCNQ